MKKLSSESFRKAVDYLYTNGRPLEQHLYTYEFSSGQPQPVLDALADFQNPDGGYGQAFEPDIRAQASTVLATSLALTLLRRMGEPAQNPQVQAAIVYLLGQFDPDQLVWPIVPQAIESDPHAPWWEVATSAETFNGFKFNPRAEVLANLTHYRDLVPNEFLNRVTEALAADIDFGASNISENEFLCLRELAETDGLPAGLQEPLTDWLSRILPELTLKGQSRWTEYGLTPLEAAPHPGTTWAQALDPAELEANLDELVERQLEDGSWPLNWSWDFINAQAWAQAEREWKGIKIVKNLESLKAYGRLDE
jgi:hypothetical protein